MNEYVINVVKIEELQMLNDLNALEKIFAKAKSTIVNGEKVILARKTSKAPAEKFDEITTLEDLENYHKQVTKYL